MTIYIFLLECNNSIHYLITQPSSRLVSKLLNLLVYIFKNCSYCCYRSRFWQEVVHSSYIARWFFICISCVSYNEYFFVNSSFLLILSNLLCCLYSIHDWHFKVHDDNLVVVAALLIGTSLDCIQCIPPIDSLVTEDTKLAVEYLLEYKPIHVNVVHYQNLRTFTSCAEAFQNISTTCLLSKNHSRRLTNVVLGVWKTTPWIQIIQTVRFLNGIDFVVFFITAWLPILFNIKSRT